MSEPAVKIQFSLVEQFRRRDDYAIQSANAQRNRRAGYEQRVAELSQRADEIRSHIRDAIPQLLGTALQSQLTELQQSLGRYLTQLQLKQTSVKGVDRSAEARGIRAATIKELHELQGEIFRTIEERWGAAA